MGSITLVIYVSRLKNPFKRYDYEGLIPLIYDTRSLELYLQTLSDNWLI